MRKIASRNLKRAISPIISIVLIISLTLTTLLIILISHEIYFSRSLEKISSFKPTEKLDINDAEINYSSKTLVLLVSSYTKVVPRRSNLYVILKYTLINDSKEHFCKVYLRESCISCPKELYGRNILIKLNITKCKNLTLGNLTSLIIVNPSYFEKRKREIIVKTAPTILELSCKNCIDENKAPSTFVTLKIKVVDRDGTLNNLRVYVNNNLAKTISLSGSYYEDQISINIGFKKNIIRVVVEDDDSLVSQKEILIIGSDYTVKIFNNNSYDLIDYQVGINLPEAKYWKIFYPNGEELKYCYEQPNGECNKSLSYKVWVKVNLSKKTNTTIFIVSDDNNNAVDGSDVFDFYEDFNSETINTSKWIGPVWDPTRGADDLSYKVENGRLIIYGKKGYGWYGFKTVQSFDGNKNYTVEWIMSVKPMGGTCSHGNHPVDLSLWENESDGTRRIFVTNRYWPWKPDYRRGKLYVTGSYVYNSPETTSNSVHNPAKYRLDVIESSYYKFYMTTDLSSEPTFRKEGSITQPLQSFRIYLITSGDSCGSSYPSQYVTLEVYWDYIIVRKYADQNPTVYVIT